MRIGSLWRSPNALLLILCGVLFLDGLDISLVGVALPAIKADLRLDASQLQWIVSGYVLGYGGLLLLGGRTADVIGRRRTLLAALAVFALASLLGALTSDPTLLVITRFLKGASAAFTAPAGLSIITTTFAEGPERNRAMSIYAATGASGFSLGLVLGGILTEIGWRWAFVLPVPIAVVLLAFAPGVLPRDMPSGLVNRKFDVPGAVTLTAGMLLFVRTIVEAPSEGWGATSTIAAFAVSTALLATFVAIERASAEPLVRLGILRSGSLVRANLGAFTMFGCYVGFQFVLTLYLQTMNGWTPIETALAFLPAGALIAVGSTRVGPVMHHIGTPRLIVLGSLSMTIGYFLLLRLNQIPAYAAVLLPTMVLVGIGIGVSFPSLNIQGTSGVADHEQGLAAGLVQSAQQLGGAIVLAVVAAIVASNGGPVGDQLALLGSYRDSLSVIAAVAAAGLIIAVAGITLGRPQRLISTQADDLKEAA